MWTNEQYEAKKAERARKRHENSKKPWWWLKQSDPVARFTLYLGIFTFVLICISVAQWCVLHGQQIVMQGQLDAMEADQRPWVSVEIKNPSNIIFDKTGGHISFVYEIRNVGKTPAVNVRLDSRMFPYKLGSVKKGIVIKPGEIPRPSDVNMPSDPVADMKKFCEEKRAVAAGAGRLVRRDTIFPNTSQSYNISPLFERTEIDDAMNRIDNQENKTVFFYLVSCVAYTSYSSSDVRVTAIMHDIHSKDPTGRSWTNAFTAVDGAIPANSIIMNLSFFGGGYAD